MGAFDRPPIFPRPLRVTENRKGKFIRLNLKELAGQRTYKRKRELGRIVVGVCHQRCWSSAGVIYTGNQSGTTPVIEAVREGVHVSFCACRWRGEIVNGGIPDSLVMWDGFGALESGICPGGTGSWMGRRPC